MGEARPVSVVVADDHEMFREGVAAMLSASGRCVVAAQAQDGRAALEAIRRERPDVAVVDQNMPELTGTQVANAVARDGLTTKVLILSAFTDSHVVYQAMQDGAAGFLPKEARRAQILDAVLACARGETVLPPKLAAGLVSEMRNRADRPALADREMEVLKLIAAGKSVPDIAAELYLGATTVKTYTSRLYEKLGVNDRAAAVAEAMRRGLIE